MLKRIPEKAGYWQPVCGGVENGEYGLEAAKRELFEETGIVPESDLIELPFEFTYTEPKNGVMMKMRDTCFLLKISSLVDVEISDEHEAYKWSALSDIKSLSDWEPILKVCEFIGENA